MAAHHPNLLQVEIYDENSCKQYGGGQCCKQYGGSHSCKQYGGGHSCKQYGGGHCCKQYDEGHVFFSCRRKRKGIK